MSRFCGNVRTEEKFKVIDNWRDNCLLGGGSLFTEQPVWNAENLDSIKRYYVNNLDSGEGKFIGKLEKQLAPATAAAKILCAEIMWVMLLCLSNIKPPSKRATINRILSWAGIEIPPGCSLTADMAISGFGSGGVVFRRVQLNTNNRFYRFLLNVCEITIASWLVDERTGRYHFRDFVRDDNAMGRLYENFILNFYKIHLKNASVKKEKIKWNASSATDPELKYLPSMETDISIRYAQRCLIIDAKFYSKTLQTYYDKESIHSANLYQIFSYLENLRSRGGGDENAEGMLLYPAIDKRIRETYNLGKRRIHICTLDLNAEWRYIHRELLDIPKAFEI
ncbi:MAG: hypothetical protein P8Y42_15185 [Exilibacterium sp.]